MYDSNIKTNCSSACVEMESTMPFGRHFLALLMATPQSTEEKTVLFEERRYISGYLQHLLLRRSSHKAGGLCAEPFSPLSGWKGTAGKDEHYMVKNSISQSSFLILKECCQSGASASTFWENWIVENEVPYTQVQGLLMKMHEHDSTQAYKHTDTQKHRV